MVIKAKKLLIIISIIFVIGAVSISGLIFMQNRAFLNNTMIVDDINIKKSEGYNSVYKRLFSDINTPIGFDKYLRHIKKFNQNIKYGYYLADNITLNQFLDNIASGKQTTIRVTIPEGFNLFEIGERLENLEITSNEEFLEAAFDNEYVEELTGYKATSMEGLLLPSTYHFPKYTDPRVILQTLHTYFKKSLPEDFEQQAAKFDLTPYELLTLASIVQKETYSYKESPVVASVFHNRLDINMRLQADPTIIYGKFVAFDGNIRKSDIRDSSNIYNTYRHNGLPPTPIANFGKVTLDATLNPADTEYLYFVADKNGKHLFSKDYRQHVNNVNRHQKR